MGVSRQTDSKLNIKALIIVSVIFLRLLFERLKSKSLDLEVTPTSKNVDSTVCLKEMAETIFRPSGQEQLEKKDAFDALILFRRFNIANWIY